jgi:rhodanese-related sulfurtransferase/DNA-binding transcriptional ArsR family regulator
MKPHPKTLIYDQLARIGKALASPARLEILDLLAQSEKTVETVAAQTRLGMKNASAHLRVLREARMVESRKEPPHVLYRLADPAVLKLVREIRDLAHDRLTEVAHITRLYFDTPSAFEPVDGDELLRRAAAGDVTVLDVRPEDEYRAGHIPGAVSMPIEELEVRLAEIPRDRPVIAYCRGPYCVFAVEAVRTLRGRGYDAARMDDGVPDWRLAGHAVEIGSSAPGPTAAAGARA